MNAGTFSVKTANAICDRHGPYTARSVGGLVWSLCTHCVAEEEAEQRRTHEADSLRKRQEQWERALDGAGIPERFRNRSLQSFVANTPGKRKALEFATRYAAEFDSILDVGRSAIFIGKPGTGKTHLATAIGLHVMRNLHRPVLFMTVMRAIRRVKDSWSRESQETETQAIESLTYPDLLILDEVGVQFGSETEKRILFDVLNERYEQRKPTILISNLGLDEVRAYVGERIFDRLREDGGEAIVFDWDSYRGTAQADTTREARDASE